MSIFTVETKMFNLSTRSTACNILNTNPDYKSKCEYDIPNMIERDETIEYIQFSIPYAVIPCSFFTINENNNVLNVVENGVLTPYTFPYGNYNSTYFVSQFKTLLGYKYNITLNPYSSIFTITNSLNSFRFLPTSTVSSIIGFSDNLTSSLVGSVYSLTLPRCCNFLPLPRITLRCPELANTTMVGNGKSSDVIITIPNNARPNGQIYYQNQTQIKLLFRHHELSRFVVSFTDDDSNLINFNGISTFFTFQFDIYRKYIQKLPKFGEILNLANSNEVIDEPTDTQPALDINYQDSRFNSFR